MTNGTIKARYVGDGHITGITPGKEYIATICKDNSKIICVVDDNGEEYGYSASEFEIIED